MTSPSSGFFRRDLLSQRAAALLIALAFLLLLSAVVMALFSTAATSRQNAAAFSAGQETQRLADAAINLVQGQIRDATIQPRVGWASQPGMIRTFTPAGGVTAYKLYSAARMVEPGYGKAQSDAEFSEIQAWNAGAGNRSFNAQFCDLNSPTVVKRPDPSNPAISIQTPVFPIADPAAIGQIEGFHAVATVAGTVLGSGSHRRLPMPVRWLYVLRDGQMVAPTGGHANRATFSGGTAPSASNPIVGRIAFWTDDETCKLNINTASEGTFWDTPLANTAIEQRLAMAAPVAGEFHRMPGHPATTCLSPVLGSAMPVDQDFFLSDRATFHSQLLSLRAARYLQKLDYFRLTPRIHGDLNDRTSWIGLRRTCALTHDDALNPSLADYYDALSRFGWPPADLPSHTSAGRSAVPGAPVSPDSDRLYASADELYFSPTRLPNDSRITPSLIQRANLVLTAHSRAPETTLWGTPRISLWPINYEQNLRTVKDVLLFHCARAGNHSYSLERVVGTSRDHNNQGAASPTWDFSLPASQRIVHYLRTLLQTPIPGAGGASFQTKWSASGVDKVAVQALDIIRCSNAEFVNFPIGNATVTYRYSTTAPSTTTQNFSATGSPPALREEATDARGYIIPGELNGARGAGRFLTIAAATLVFCATEIEYQLSGNLSLNGNFNGLNYNGTLSNGYLTANGHTRTYSGNFSPPLPGNATVLRTSINQNPVSGNFSFNSLRTSKMRAFLFFQPYNPTPGGAINFPGGRIRVSGLSSLSTNLGSFAQGDGILRFGCVPNMRHWALPRTPFPSPYYFFLTPPSKANFPPSQWGFDMNVVRTIVKWPAGYGPPVFSVATGSCDPADIIYPFVSAEWEVPPGVTSFNFSGGTLDVTLLDYNTNTSLQNFVFEFPGVNGLAVPQFVVQKTLPRTFNADGNASAMREGGQFNAGAHNESWLFLPLRFRANSDSEVYERRLVQDGDVALGLVISTGPPVGGDPRMLILHKSLPRSWFVPAQGYPGFGGHPVPVQHSISSNGTVGITASSVAGRFAYFARNDWKATVRNPQDQFTSRLGSAVDIGAGRLLRDFHRSSFSVGGLPFFDRLSPVFGQGLTAVQMGGNGPAGDITSSTGLLKDGGVFRAIEFPFPTKSLSGYFPYLKLEEDEVHFLPDRTAYEPNRMIPSAGLLGQILTPNGAGELQGWQTLLLNPRPLAGNAHPGFADPRDHFLMDFFWMPVIEPYAISEPLSTAGKVNLNTQILPFAHIQRDTALRGTLKPVMLGQIEDDTVQPSGSDPFTTSDAACPDAYNHGNIQLASRKSIRASIHINATMDRHRQRFDRATAPNFYLSASEVTEIELVPQDGSGNAVSNLNAWWNNRRATTDTLREQPYTALLSRVTTKSNTFTVYYRVQALRQMPRAGRNWAEWEEGLDRVVGEHRGSATIERFLDPNEPNIPDYTQVHLSGNYTPIDRYYRWRVLTQRQFAP